MKHKKTFKILTVGALSLSLLATAGVPHNASAATPSPVKKPTYPSSFKASTTQTSVSLSWGKVTGATSYEVLKNGVKVYSGPAVSFVDKNVKAASSYTYTLVAKNASGSSASVSLSAKTPAIPKPSSPTGLKASPLFTTVSLTWNKVANAVTYEIQRGGVKIYEGAALSFVDKTAKPNTSYTYTILAKNASGSSAAVKTVTKTLGAPSSPTNFTANPQFTSVLLKWNSVKNVASYEVQRDGLKVYEGPSVSFFDRTATPGTSYTYTIVAKNQAGSSAVVKKVTKTLGAPSSPTGLKVNPSFTTVSLAWSKVANASSYEVQRDGVKVYEGTSLAFVDKNAKANTSYTYTVQAKNPAGSSVATKIVTKTLGAPVSPTGIRVTPVSGTVKVAFNKVKNATSYEIQRDGVKIYSGSSLTFIDKNVKVNTPYIYTVIAKNQAGSSVAVNVATKTPNIAKPSSPTGLKATSKLTSVSLTWNKVTNATSYEVQKNGVKVYEGSSLSFIDKGAKANTSYSYTVIAKNAGGSSTGAKLTAKTLTEKQDLINNIDANYSGSSLVDYLKAAKQPNSYSDREKLAGKLGISKYSGTASQNAAILKLLKSDGK